MAPADLFPLGITRFFLGFDHVLFVLALILLGCGGDCNSDRQVTVDELVRGVNIALGNATSDTCPAMDANADGEVTVNELIQAVKGSLDGCPRLCTNYNPLRNAYFGDLHVHTALSFDANSYDVQTTPAQAYRFAQGEAITLPPLDADGKGTE